MRRLTLDDAEAGAELLRALQVDIGYPPTAQPATVREWIAPFEHLDARTFHDTIVDAFRDENSSGATRLYERAGMSLATEDVVYERSLT